MSRGNCTPLGERWKTPSEDDFWNQLARNMILLSNSGSSAPSARDVRGQAGSGAARDDPSRAGEASAAVCPTATGATGAWAQAPTLVLDPPAIVGAPGQTVVFHVRASVLSWQITGLQFSVGFDSNVA